MKFTFKHAYLYFRYEYIIKYEVLMEASSM